MMLSAVLAAATVAMAQGAAPAAAAAPAAEATAGVLSYPPAYFAEVGPSTAYDIVLRLPGFSFDKGTAVRGLAGAGGNVLIDGEAPVSKNDTLDEILKRIPVASIVRVDVIRGGAPGIDMQGRTVIANVVRKSQAGFKGAASLTTWPIYDGRVLNGVRAEGQWRWDGKLLEASMVLGKGPNDQLGDGPRIRVGPTGQTLIQSRVDGDGQGQKEWLMGAYETPLAGGRLRINGAYMVTPGASEMYDFISYPTVSREYQYGHDDRLQAEFGGRYTKSFGKTSMEALAFQQWNNLDSYARFESPTLNRLFLAKKEVTESVGRLHFRRRSSPDLNLEAGVEGALNKLDSLTSLKVNSAAVRLPAGNVQVEEKRAEVFGVATWQVNPKLSVEAAVRQERSTVTSTGDVALEKTLSFTKPRIAVTWSPDETNQVRLRLEREVSQLNFDDFVASNSVANTGAVIAGNPDLSPQQSWVVEAALEHRFWGRGAAIFTLRHAELTDVIDRAPIQAGAVVADAPANIGDGTKDEAQFSLSVPLERVGLKSAMLKGAVTARRSEVIDPTTLKTREISALRPVEWEVHYTQDLPSLKTNIGVDVTGGYRERFYRLSEIETNKIEIWTVVFAEYKPRPDLIFRAEVQAPLNRDAVRIREVSAGPRNSTGLIYTDYRSLQWDGGLQLRVRKLFG